MLNSSLRDNLYELYTIIVNGCINLYSSHKPGTPVINLTDSPTLSVCYNKVPNYTWYDFVLHFLQDEELASVEEALFQRAVERSLADDGTTIHDEKR